MIGIQPAKVKERSREENMLEARVRKKKKKEAQSKLSGRNVFPPGHLVSEDSMVNFEQQKSGPAGRSISFFSRQMSKLSGPSDRTERHRNA